MNVAIILGVAVANAITNEQSCVYRGARAIPGVCRTSSTTYTTKTQTTISSTTTKSSVTSSTLTSSSVSSSTRTTTTSSTTTSSTMVCSCFNGTATSSCSTIDIQSCDYCDYGFVLEEDEGVRRCLPGCVCQLAGTTVGTGTLEGCPFQYAVDCASCFDGYHIEHAVEFGRNYSACQENDCKCSHGVAAKGEECLTHQSETCTSCSFGYGLNLETLICEKHECSCPNGEPEYLCQENGFLECQECYAGYHLQGTSSGNESNGVGDFQCVENYCPCTAIVVDGALATEISLGTGASGFACAEDGTMACSDCIPGYGLSPLGICEPYHCQCKNGSGTVSRVSLDGTLSEICEQSGAFKCSDCDMFHTLNIDTNQCDRNECPCTNGIAVELCVDPTYPTEQCERCHNGYIRKETLSVGAYTYFECVPKQCVCEVDGEVVGIGATGPACYSDGEGSCSSCNEGYSMSCSGVVGKTTCTCDKNECKCENGYANPFCPVNGAHDCIACRLGYELDLETKTCVQLNSCLCANGSPAQTCLASGVDSCARCNSGYDLQKQIVENSLPPILQVGEAGLSFACQINQCFCSIYVGMEEIQIGEPSTGLDCPEQGALGCSSCIPGYHLGNHFCYENICSCDHGDYYVGEPCLEHKGQLCYACDYGYELNETTKACDKIECRCDNGTPPNICESTSQLCNDCNPGYELQKQDDTLVCVERECACENGIGGRGPECPLDPCDATNDNFCELRKKTNCTSCNVGYTLYKNSRYPNIGIYQCYENICSCNNGKPNATCLVHKSEDCVACEKTYELNQSTKTCDPINCNCTNGVPLESCLDAHSQNCQSCDQPFYLTRDAKCAPPECTCYYSSFFNGEAMNKEVHGRGATFAEGCPEHQSQMCAECDVGWHLALSETNQSICVPNECLCANGTGAVTSPNYYVPAHQQMCEVHGGEKCSKCDLGWEINTTDHTCQLQTEDCLCTSGTARQPCQDRTVEDCVACDSGHSATTWESITDEVGNWLGKSAVPPPRVFCRIWECFCTNSSREGSYFDKTKVDVGIGSTGTDCPFPYAEDCESCFPGYKMNTTVYKTGGTIGQVRNECIPQVCPCENGRGVVSEPLDGPKCLDESVSHCMACDHQYHLEGTLCEKNKCTCANGQLSQFCAEHGSESCEFCNPGYHEEVNEVTNQTNCVINDCICDSGIGSTGISCYSHQSQHCSSCDGGYVLSQDGPTFSVCMLPSCSCEYGTPSTQPFVCAHGGNACSSCRDNVFDPVTSEFRAFHLVGITCVPNMGDDDCSCYHGTPNPEGCDPSVPFNCTDCDLGYTLVTNGNLSTCEINNCSCSNGQPYYSPRYDKMDNEICNCLECEKCISCNFGYTMNDTTSLCDRNPCECANGTSADLCEVTEEERCVTCDSGYLMVNQSCVPTKCTCMNGGAAVGADCFGIDVEQCAYCNQGFVLDLATLTCLPQNCSCANGTAYDLFTYCQDTGIACRACDAGFVLDEDNLVCQPECICSNGDRTDGSLCPSPGYHQCSDCLEGYYLNESTLLCDANICLCSNGIAGNSSCFENLGEGCVACNKGYHLNDLHCVEGLQCPCANGVGAIRNDCPGANTCSSCDAGYSLDMVNLDCDENICSCANGQAAVASDLIPCNFDGSEQCSSCNSGYTLSAQSLCEEIVNCSDNQGSYNGKCVTFSNIMLCSQTISASEEQLACAEAGLGVASEVYISEILEPEATLNPLLGLPYDSACSIAAIMVGWVNHSVIPGNVSNYYVLYGLPNENGIRQAALSMKLSNPLAHDAIREELFGSNLDMNNFFDADSSDGDTEDESGGLIGVFKDVLDPVLLETTEYIQGFTASDSKLKDRVILPFPFVSETVDTTLDLTTCAHPVLDPLTSLQEASLIPDETDETNEDLNQFIADLEAEGAESDEYINMLEDLTVTTTEDGVVPTFPQVLSVARLTTKSATSVTTVSATSTASPSSTSSSVTSTFACPQTRSTENVGLLRAFGISSLADLKFTYGFGCDCNPTTASKLSSSQCSARIGVGVTKTSSTSTTSSSTSYHGTTRSTGTTPSMNTTQDDDNGGGKSFFEKAWYYLNLPKQWNRLPMAKYAKEKSRCEVDTQCVHQCDVVMVLQMMGIVEFDWSYAISKDKDQWGDLGAVLAGLIPGKFRIVRTAGAGLPTDRLGSTYSRIYGHPVNTMAAHNENILRHGYGRVSDKKNSLVLYFSFLKFCYKDITDLMNLMVPAGVSVPKTDKDRWSLLRLKVKHNWGRHLLIMTGGKYNFSESWTPKYAVQKIAQTFLSGYRREIVYRSYARENVRTSILIGMAWASTPVLSESAGYNHAWEATLESTGIKFSDFGKSGLPDNFDGTVRIQGEWKNLNLGFGVQKRAHCGTFCDGMFLFEDVNIVLASHEMFLLRDETGNVVEDYNKCDRGERFVIPDHFVDYVRKDLPKLPEKFKRGKRIALAGNDRRWCLPMFMETDLEKRRSLWQSYIEKASYTTLMELCTEFIKYNLQKSQFGYRQIGLRIKSLDNDLKFGQTPGRLFTHDEPRKTGLVPNIEIAVELTFKTPNTNGCGRTKIRFTGGYKPVTGNFGKFFDPTIASQPLNDGSGYPRGPYTFCNGNIKDVHFGYNSKPWKISYGLSPAGGAYWPEFAKRQSKAFSFLLRLQSPKQASQYNDGFEYRNRETVLPGMEHAGSKPEHSIWRNVLNELFKMWADPEKVLIAIKEMKAEIEKEKSVKYDDLQEASKWDLEQDFFSLGDEDLTTCSSSVSGKIICSGAREVSNKLIYRALYNQQQKANRLSEARKEAIDSGFYLTAQLPDITIKQIICWGLGVDPGFDSSYDEALVCKTYTNQYLDEMLGPLGHIPLLEEFLKALMEIGMADVQLKLSIPTSGNEDFGCIPNREVPEPPGLGSSTTEEQFAQWQSDLAACQQLTTRNGCLEDTNPARDCQWKEQSEADINGGLAKLGRSCGPSFSVSFVPVIPSGFPINAGVPSILLKTPCKRAYPYGARTPPPSDVANNRMRMVRRGWKDPEEARKRRSIAEYFPPIVLGWEYAGLGPALAAIDLDLGPLTPFINSALKSFLPESLTLALVLSTHDINPVYDSEVLPDLDSVALLPASFIIPRGISVIGVLSVADGCEKSDLICTFIHQNFGVNALLMLAISISFEPGIQVTAAVGGISLIKNKKCNSSSGVDELRLDSVGIYVSAKMGTPPAFELGLDIQMSYELGNRPASTCGDGSGMIEPLIFIGRLYVRQAAVLEIGGSLVMRGVVYQLFGLDFLHIADLGVGLAFAPPNPIPTKIEAAGTIAIGRECYTRDEETGAISEVTDSDRACVSASVAFGLDADQPENNYFSAKLFGFNVKTMMQVFAPARMAEKMINALPGAILNSGFEGETIFSFSPTSAGSLTVTGDRVPGGLRIAGTFNMLGYKVACDIKVIPFVSIDIQGYMDPITIGSKSNPFFSIGKAKSDFLVSCGSNLTSLSGNASIKSKPRNDTNISQSSLITGNGPYVSIYAGLGGSSSDTSGLAAAGSAAILTGDTSGLLPQVDISISGEINSFFGNGGAVMEVNSTHFLVCAYVDGFFGIPGLYASFEASAFYGSLENSAFYVAGEIGVANIVSRLADKFLAILGVAKQFLDLIGGENGPMATLLSLDEEMVDIIEAVEDDIPLGACLSATVKGVQNLLKAAFSPVLSLVGLNSISDLKDWIVDGISSLSNQIGKLEDAVNSTNLTKFDEFIDLSLSFAFSSGDSRTSVSVNGQATFFGSSTSFSSTLNFGMDIGDMLKVVADKIVEGTLFIVGIAEDVKDFIVGIYQDIADFDFNAAIANAITDTWNGVRRISNDLADAADTAVGVADDAIALTDNVFGVTLTIFDELDHWDRKLQNLQGTPFGFVTNTIGKVTAKLTERTNSWAKKINDTQLTFMNVTDMLYQGISELRFPKLNRTKLQAKFGGKLLLTFFLQNGAEFELDLKARRRRETVLSSGVARRATCANQASDIFNLVLEKLAPFYNSVKGYVFGLVNKTLEVFQPVINTVELISAYVKKGEYILAKPVDLGNGLLSLRDYQNKSQGPRVIIPVGNANEFVFRGAIRLFGTLISVNMTVSTTQLYMQSSLKMFNVFETISTIDFVYTSQFTLTGVVTLTVAEAYVKAALKAILNVIKVVTNEVLGEGKFVDQILTAITQLDAGIAFLDNLPMGSCLSSAADAAVNLVDSALTDIYPSGVHNISQLAEWLQMKRAELVTYVDSLDVNSPGILSLGGNFALAAGKSTVGFQLGVQATAFGKSSSLNVGASIDETCDDPKPGYVCESEFCSLASGPVEEDPVCTDTTDCVCTRPGAELLIEGTCYYFPTYGRNCVSAVFKIQEFAEDIATKIVAATMPVMNTLKTVANKVKNQATAIVGFTRFSCGSSCRSSIIHLYNLAKTAANTVIQGLLGAVNTLNGFLQGLSGVFDSINTARNKVSNAVGEVSGYVKYISTSLKNSFDNAVSTATSRLNSTTNSVSRELKNIANVSVKLSASIEELTFPNLVDVDMTVDGIKGEFFMHLSFQDADSLEVFNVTLNLGNRRRAERALDLLNSDDAALSRARRDRSCSDFASELLDELVEELAPIYKSIKNTYQTVVNGFSSVVNTLQSTVNSVINFFSQKMITTRSCSCRDNSFTYAAGVCVGFDVRFYSKQCDSPRYGYSCVNEACAHTRPVYEPERNGCKKRVLGVCLDKKWKSCEDNYYGVVIGGTIKLGGVTFGIELSKHCWFDGALAYTRSCRCPNGVDNGVNCMSELEVANTDIECSGGGSEYACLYPFDVCIRKNYDF